MIEGGRHRDLGGELAAMALKRLALGPQAIARRMEETTGCEISPREVLSYLDGTRPPHPKFIPAFAEAFSLTTEERKRLAWLYTFSELPDRRPAETSPPPQPPQKELPENPDPRADPTDRKNPPS